MSERDALLEKIRAGFRDTTFPGDAYLVGSTEGCGPEDEAGAFRGRTDWQKVEPAFLDAHANALSFFSGAGLRFFLPAYLMADVRGELKSADPVIPLTHGFSDAQVTIPVNGRDFLVRTGKSELVNPRRYGAATFYDYACYRLSIFTREEAQAIVAYLEYKRDADPQDPNRICIDAALRTYWLDRAAKAPDAASLARHENDQNEFIEAVHNAQALNSARPSG